MQIGVVGLGRMDGNIVRRLMQQEHQAIVYDRNSSTVAEPVGSGAAGTGGLDELAVKPEIGNKPHKARRP